MGINHIEFPDEHVLGISHLLVVLNGHCPTPLPLYPTPTPPNQPQEWTKMGSDSGCHFLCLGECLRRAPLTGQHCPPTLDSRAPTGSLHPSPIQDSHATSLGKLWVSKINVFLKTKGVLVPVISKMSFFILLITPSVQLHMNNYALKMVCLYVPSDRCFFLFLRTQVPCERGLWFQKHQED